MSVPTTPSQKPQSIWILGCGYLGTRLARGLVESGSRVLAHTRTSAHAARLVAAGIPTVARDLDDRSDPPGLDTAPPPTAFYLVPPPSSGEDDPRLVRFLQTLSVPPRRLVYLSTSGVYGDCNGALVDEDRPPQPLTARARRRLAAEESVRSWCQQHDVGWIILRAPGIYGPERLPLDRLAAGAPFLRDADAPPGNRIHRDDLVGACRAALSTSRGDRVYNVSDGNWSSSTAFARLVARLAGLPPPHTVAAKQAETALSPGQRSFLSESRRIDNRRMVTELGVTLAYADPADGIRQALAEQGHEIAD